MRGNQPADDVSRRGDSQFGYLIDDVIARRAVEGIQKKIVKQGKRNVVSRHLHAKDDKERIATWRSDLNRILHVFNVRPAVPVWPVLTFRPQTELAINTHVIVSDIRHDVTNTQAVVSAVRHDVSNTHTIVSGLHHNVADTHALVSDIHSTMMKSQETVYGQTLPVSIVCTHSSLNKRSPLH